MEISPEIFFPPARTNAEVKGQTWPGRIPAVTDTKMIVAWNSLIISGLAAVARVFGDRQALEFAIGAANYIWDSQRLEDGTFACLNYDGVAVESAKSEDYASCIKALLDLQQASQAFPDLSAPDWLPRALELQQEDELIVREKDDRDNATPAGNGLAIQNLVRLFGLTGDSRWWERAEQALVGWSHTMERFPRACPMLFAALDSFCNQIQVTISPDNAPTLLARYLPTTSIQLDEQAPGVGLVCIETQCLKPTDSLEILFAQLEVNQCRQ